MSFASVVANLNNLNPSLGEIITGNIISLNNVPNTLYGGAQSTIALINLSPGNYLVTFNVCAYNPQPDNVSLVQFFFNYGLISQLVSQRYSYNGTTSLSNNTGYSESVTLPISLNAQTSCSVSIQVTYAGPANSLYANQMNNGNFYIYATKIN